MKLQWKYWSDSNVLQNQEKEYWEKKKKVDKKFWRYFLDLANTTLFFSFDSIKKN